MSMQDIAAAMQRAQAALERRPDMGLHDDAPATARWQGGVRVESSHANGTAMLTDMPCELGGSGDRVTPAGCSAPASRPAPPPPSRGPRQPRASRWARSRSA